MKNYNLNTLTSIGVHYQRQSVFSILSHCSDTYQRAQNHKTLGPSTSQGGTTLKSNINMFIKSSRLVKSSLLALFILASGIFFSHSAYAGTSISISNSSNNISFTSVKPSASGSVTTATDTIDITTDCAAGFNVYISAVDGSSYSTNLVNNAAVSNNTISTLSGTTIGTTALFLENNTWGFNTDSTAASNGNYYGLPAYANATDHAIYSGTNTTVPIYYGAKVTNSLVPGKYIGQVLYTATVNSSCLAYTVSFDKNAEDATGTMADQSIPPSVATPLMANGFSRSGYIFLGWSTNQNATTATYTDGQSVTDLTTSLGSITLYAVWGRSMQDWATNFGCATLNTNDYLTLYDSRDKNSYVVKKLADNKCWMVQNLRLTNYNLTSADSNVSSNFDITTSNVVQSGSSGWCEDDDGSCINKKSVYYDASTRSSYGALYNYYTATAGTGDYNTVSSNAPSDICPAGWHLPTDGAEGGDFETLYMALGSNAAVMEQAYTNGSGANFDLAGFLGNQGIDYGNVGAGGYWWSSTATSSKENSYVLSVNYMPRVDLHYARGKYTGRSIRCITDINNATGYMQDTSCSSLPLGVTTTLMDKRDRQDYPIYRWSNISSYPSNMAGYCIMSKDLGLGYVTSGTITKGQNLTLSTTESTGAGNVVARANAAAWSNDNTNSNLQYVNGAGGEYDGHSYYSYPAAQIVCPKGWRLPTIFEYDNIVTFVGGNSSTGSSNIRNTPYNFVYGGYYNTAGLNNAGSYGSYWASSQLGADPIYGQGIQFESSSLLVNYNSKNVGRSVRCLAENQIENLGNCSDNVHPTTSQSCKMNDNRLWVIGNIGRTISWTDMFTYANNTNDHDATTNSGICPSGYNAPKIIDYDALIQAYGGTALSGARDGYQESTGALYSMLGLSSSRNFWSSTELGSNSAYYLSVGSSKSYSSHSYTKSNNNYVLCYK